MSAIPNYFQPFMAAATPVAVAPDALDWADLPDESAEPTPETDRLVRATGRSPLPEPPDADTRFVGWIEAECTVVEGPLDLEVTQDTACGWIEIGPFRLRPAEARRLVGLLREYLAAAGVWRHLARRAAPPAESGRGIAGWDLAAGTGDPLAKAGAVARTLTRNPDGRAVCPPWEGETLP